MSVVRSLVAAASMLAACSPTRGEAFAPVQRIALERTGHRVRWQSRAIDDEKHAAKLAEMLSQPLSVDDSVKIALLNNKDLQASFELVGMGLADVAEATLENPEVDADLRLPLDGTGSAIDLTAVQDLLSLLTLPGRRDAASAELSAARYEAVGAVVSLAASVSTAFYDAQAASQAEQLRRAVRDSQATQLDLTERLHRAGNVTDLALAQSWALLAEAKLELARAEVEVVVSRERLNGLLGLSGRDTGWTLVPRLADLPATEIDLGDLEQRAISQSVALERERWRMKAAASRIGVARIEAWMPRLGVGASAEREFDGEWSVGPAITLSLPLWDRRKGARVRGHAELRRAQRRYHAIAVMARAQARAARHALSAGRARVAFIHNDLLPTRQRVLAETLKHYNAMDASPFELLAAKREETAVRVEHIEALRDYWKARVAIEKIQMGSSTDSMGDER